MFSQGLNLIAKLISLKNGFHLMTLVIKDSFKIILYSIPIDFHFIYLNNKVQGITYVRHEFCFKQVMTLE